MENYNIQEKKKETYKVRIYDERGGLVFKYENDDYDQVLKVAEAFKLCFSDVEMTEH